MIDLDETYLSPEHMMLREQLRRFIVAEILPEAEAWEEAGEVPRSVFTRMGELGFLGVTMPEAYGGSDFDALGGVVFGEELGRSAYGGFASAISDHADITAPIIRRNGAPEQLAAVLPDMVAGRRIAGLAVTEPTGGSDLTRMKTTAVRDGDDYVLNGHKTYITNAIAGEIFVTVARTDPDAKGAAGFSLFMVEKGGKGFTTGSKFRKTGLLSSDLSDLFFDDFRVPARNRLGEEGRGFYLMMQGIENERLSIGAQCVGAAERALEVTLDYVRQRPAYGGVLWNLQAVRHDLARAASELGRGQGPARPRRRPQEPRRERPARGHHAQGDPARDSQAHGRDLRPASRRPGLHARNRYRASLARRARPRPGRRRFRGDARRGRQAAVNRPVARRRVMRSIIGPIYLMSNSTKPLFGDKAEAFEADPFRALLSLNPVGVFTEHIEAEFALAPGRTR